MSMRRAATNDEQRPDSSAGGSRGRSVPPGGLGGDRTGSQGARGSGRQVATAYIWPTFDQVVGTLYKIATCLFGSADNPYPAFRIRDRWLLESVITLLQHPYYEMFHDGLAAMVRSIAANHSLERQQAPRGHGAAQHTAGERLRVRLGHRRCRGGRSALRVRGDRLHVAVGVHQVLDCSHRCSGADGAVGRPERDGVSP